MGGSNNVILLSVLSMSDRQPCGLHGWDILMIDHGEVFGNPGGEEDGKFCS